MCNLSIFGYEFKIVIHKSQKAMYFSNCFWNQPFLDSNYLFSSLSQYHLWKQYVPNEWFLVWKIHICLVWVSIHQQTIFRIHLLIFQGVPQASLKKLWCHLNRWYTIWDAFPPSMTPSGVEMWPVHWLDQKASKHIHRTLMVLWWMLSEVN